MVAPTDSVRHPLPRGQESQRGTRLRRGEAARLDRQAAVSTPWQGLVAAKPRGRVGKATRPPRMAIWTGGPRSGCSMRRSRKQRRTSNLPRPTGWRPSSTWCPRHGLMRCRCRPTLCARSASGVRIIPDRRHVHRRGGAGDSAIGARRSTSHRHQVTRRQKRRRTNTGRAGVTGEHGTPPVPQSCPSTTFVIRLRRSRSAGSTRTVQSLMVTQKSRPQSDTSTRGL